MNTSELLDSIDVGTPEKPNIVGLRDRALIGTIVFSFARVSAVLGMNVGDYFQDGKRWWFRLHEKGGKLHEVPAHHTAHEYLHDYLAAAGTDGGKKAPLFRTVDRRRKLTANRMHPTEVLLMIKRRSSLRARFGRFTTPRDSIQNYNKSEFHVAGGRELSQPTEQLLEAGEGH